MRKITGFVLTCVLTAAAIAGCSGNGTSARPEASSGASALEEEIERSGQEQAGAEDSEKNGPEGERAEEAGQEEEQSEEESALPQRWPVGT